MSFSFYVYAAPETAPAMFQWERNLATSLGDVDSVKASLLELFPGLEWPDDGGGHDGRVPDPVYGCFFRIGFLEVEPGQVAAIITDNRASPASLCRIMDRFGANHCWTEFGDRRHPCRCNADWQERP